MAPLWSTVLYVLLAVLLLSSAAAPLYNIGQDTSTVLQVDAHYTVQRRVKRSLANNSEDATSGALKEMLKQKLHLLLRQITIPDSNAPVTPTEYPLPEKESGKMKETGDVSTRKESTPSPGDGEREYRNKEGGNKKTERKKNHQQHTQLRATASNPQRSDICFLRQLKTKFPESGPVTVLTQLLMRELKTDSTKDDDPCDEDVNRIMDIGHEDYQQEVARERKQSVVAANSNRNDGGPTGAKLRIRLVVNLPLEEVLEAVRNQTKSLNAIPVTGIRLTRNQHGDNYDSSTYATIALSNPEINSENPSITPRQEVKIDLPSDKRLATDQFQVDMQILDPKKQIMATAIQKQNESKGNDIEALLKLLLATKNNKVAIKSSETMKSNENSKNVINHRLKRSYSYQPYRLQ